MRKDWLKMARVLGICPTIDSPIKSNDGYLIRFRPKYGYLSSKQLSILADAISCFGSNCSTEILGVTISVLFGGPFGSKLSGTKMQLNYHPAAWDYFDFFTLTDA